MGRPDSRLLLARGAEWLRESTEDTNMPFINTIFSELTTLGFIGSVLFVMSKSGYLSQISKALFGPNKAAELEETIELLHMALFLFIVIFLMLCLTLLKFGIQVQHEFREFERRAPYVQVVVADYCLASEPATFPFNEYLTIISGDVMAKLIQIDGVTWVALEICIMTLLATCWAVGPDNEVFVFGVAGGLLVLLNQFVYGRIRHMRKQLTPPILFHKAERYRANGAWRAQHNLPPLRSPPRASFVADEKVPLLPPTDEKTSLVDLFVPPYVHELPQGGVHLTMSQLQDAQKKLLGGGNGVVLALFSTRLVFLFTALHLSVFVLRTLPLLVHRTDLDAVAKALCVAVSILPSCIVTSMSIVIARVGLWNLSDGLYAFNVEALKAPRVMNKVMRIVKARQTLRTLRFIAEMKLYLQEHDDQNVEMDKGTTNNPSSTTTKIISDDTPSSPAALARGGPSSLWGRSQGRQFMMKGLPSFHLDDNQLDDPTWLLMSPRTRTAVEVPMSPMYDPPPFLESHPMATKEHYAAETERREINSIFSLIDKDKSGTIYTDEMESFLQQISPDMTTDQIQRIMDDLDKHKSGGVAFDDFETWCRTHIH
ncbi:hypothetical protein DYB38_010653, partial [Aphanomyces astaci]